jgi:hypothetical protein
MAKEKLHKIVVRLLANHPTGSRKRAGFVFGQNPSSVEVTDEQLAQIKEDQYLTIVTKGEALKQATP